MTEGNEERDETGQGGDEALPTLEARLKRLEEILGQLEADEVELDRALALFEEGVRLVRQSEAILSESMLRVEEILSDGSLRPFEEPEEG
ncbi:MAG: exodeoxyribonuclease VII small subunit [Gemmatimonadota bacterium]